MRGESGSESSPKCVPIKSYLHVHDELGELLLDALQHSAHLALHPDGVHHEVKRPVSGVPLVPVGLCHGEGTKCSAAGAVAEGELRKMR